MKAAPDVVALPAILDALTLLQEQLLTLADACDRMETAQNALMRRVEAIAGGQGAGAELQSALEMILARSIEDRKLTQAQFSTVAAAVGFAHAAASGSRSPLPTDIASDPLLERFLLAQPADMISSDRALVDWRRVVSAADTAELVFILKRQYEPSPSDTAETRILRYQLAAITREQIRGRGGVPPEPPSTSVAADRSGAAQRARSGELAQLWRAGESLAFFADPELAGVIDVFRCTGQRVAAAGCCDLSPQLVSLFKELGDCIEAGGRPTMANAQPPESIERVDVGDVDYQR